LELPLAGLLVGPPLLGQSVRERPLEVEDPHATSLALLVAERGRFHEFKEAVLVEQMSAVDSLDVFGGVLVYFELSGVLGEAEFVAELAVLGGDALDAVDQKVDGFSERRCRFERGVVRFFLDGGLHTFPRYFLSLSHHVAIKRRREIRRDVLYATNLRLDESHI
jgi:hypothetical protein